MAGEELGARGRKRRREGRGAGRLTVPATKWKSLAPLFSTSLAAFHLGLRLMMGDETSMCHCPWCSNTQGRSIS